MSDAFDQLVSEALRRAGLPGKEPPYSLTRRRSFKAAQLQHQRHASDRVVSMLLDAAVQQHTRAMLADR